MLHRRRRTRAGACGDRRAAAWSGSAASAADRVALLAGELVERVLLGHVLNPPVVDKRHSEHALAAHALLLDGTVVLLRGVVGRQDHPPERLGVGRIAV